MQKIYLDNNATTPLDPRVLEVMLQELKGPAANPSSVHSFGQKARYLLSEARQKVADYFNTSHSNILFTSGGTESINLFLRSLPSRSHVVTTSIEHSAIYQTLSHLPLEVTYLPVGLYGAPDPSAIMAAIRPNTSALVFTAANSETGVKIDLAQVSKIAISHNIPLFIDAVSYIGKEPLFPLEGITAIALSAHKFHGPKGVGALYIRDMKLKPLITGGAQEQGLRAGTENLAGIIGLGQALSLLSPPPNLFPLREHFETELFRSLKDLVIQGEGPRISNTSNIAFLGVDGETLLMQLDLAGIAASHGSACSSNSIEPSRILLNMGVDKKRARSSLRFSFSRFNTLDEIDQALEKIVPIVQTLREC